MLKLNQHLKQSCIALFLSCCSLSLLANFLPTPPISKVERPTIFESLLSEDILEITLHTAFDSLLINKKTSVKYHPAQLTYKDKNGNVVERKIKVRPRGKSRRKLCDFPPLKLKFSKKELAGENIQTDFRSLKLVTHCSDEQEAKANVLEEYLAYKIYNQLTDKSLRVQLVRIYYKDTNSKSILKRYGVLLEDIDEMAARVGGEEFESFNMLLEAFNTQNLQLFSMFQYMIGNEDWRIPFMRNVKFVKVHGKETLLPVPYDFDFCGLVNAGYAKPDADYRMKSVQQRVFQGGFANEAERGEMVQFFLSKKQNILNVIDNLKQMRPHQKEQSKAYLLSFFEIIENPDYLNIAIPVGAEKPMPTDIDGRLKI